MDKRLLNILGDGIEELYFVPNDVTNEVVEEIYKEYLNSEYESFEDYLDNFAPQMQMERIFYDEIYINV